MERGILVQLLLSSATCLIAYALTREFSGDEGAARVCALLVATNPVLIFYSNQPLTETLHVFFLLSSLSLLYLQRYWAGSAAWLHRCWFGRRSTCWRHFSSSPS